MTDSILVLGAGGHGKVVADCALSCGLMVAGFIDDAASPSLQVLGIPVLGPLSELPRLRAADGAVVVAIGDGPTRIALIEHCRSIGLRTPTLIHPSSTVSRFASLGEGTVVLAQAAVNAGARLGLGVIVNTGATVDHDCAVADGVHVCPGAHLAGNVRVGRCSWIGVGSSVKQGIVIGSSAVVGAGAAVVSDVPDGATVVGVPAGPAKAQT
jgi:sugar O-acyltransferase (sialic acid O-acetyltransferase NeuD family)